MLVNNLWVRASGDLNGVPISIQFRKEWEAARDAGNYPQCVQIAWNASTRDDSSGFPGASEQAQILLFHEALQAALEPQENAVVVMMITHSGINQWIIYCNDLEQLQQDLDTVPTEKGLYPIEVVADEDTGWNTFTQVHSAIQP
ncbi:hypothetical protein CHH28_12175 [Bacterioplanes sanyensis]|uniref:DUF695 domain-containing protein n=1 Tax=Bacterioplanes sanyensis TaxID=1249553 RepID=A0A222FLW8_9GAMM|nr:DUF695 domain-containing protein [Bacterioplanes sanyensis]ASP39381.1 hypothetical protein CHH28_12175 [Bacterioplanes sanyensis]